MPLARSGVSLAKKELRQFSNGRCEQSAGWEQPPTVEPKVLASIVCDFEIICGNLMGQPELQN